MAYKRKTTDYTTWLIGWMNNRRVCSHPLNDHNRAVYLSLFGARLIQRDCTGTEHYELARAPKFAEIIGQEFRTA